MHLWAGAVNLTLEESCRAETFANTEGTASP
jgi:hypothetical protein